MDDASALTAESLLAHAGWMRTLARGLVGDPECADDVVQESLMAAIERPPRHARHPAAWLRRVVTNRARQLGRSETRRRRRDQARAVSEALPSTLELIEQAELQREVVSAVLNLAEPYRTTVLLRFYRDRTPQEIATLQDIPPATVRSRLKRGLEQLREGLDRRFDGDRRAWSCALLPLARSPGLRTASLGTSLVALGVATKIGLGLAGVAGLTGLGWMLQRGAGPSAAPPPAPEIATTTPASEERGREPGDRAALEAPSAADERQQLARTERDPGAVTGRAAWIGSVSDRDGEPIVNASVALYPIDPPEGSTFETLAPFTTGATDAEGRFAIPVPADLPGDTTATVRASAPGYGSASVNPAVPGEARELTLGWITDLFGRVVDGATGEPVEGVRVSLSPVGSSTRSDAGGTFRLVGVPAGQQLGLVASHASYVEFEDQHLLHRHGANEVTVELERGVPITVQVIDSETLEPMPGVRVCRGSRADALLAETDATGRFSLSLAVGHELSVSLHEPGYALFSWSWEVADTSDLGQPRIPMKGLGWIHGSLRDEDGEPVSAFPYATNEAHRFARRLAPEEALELGIRGYATYRVPREGDGSPLRGQPTESRSGPGSYAVPVIPDASPYRIHSGSRDHVPLETGPLLVTHAGQRVRADLVLQRGGSIRGKVLYNGEPFPRGNVFYEHENGTHGGYVDVEEHGEYLLPHVEPGPVKLHVRRPFGRSAVLPEPVQVVVESGRELEQDIVWEEALASIRGFVLESDRTPVVDQSVTASLHEPNGAIRSFGAHSDTDGAFELRVPPGASYTLRAFRRPARATLEDVAAGSEGIELVLPQTGQVRLRPVDAATGETVAVTPGVYGLAWRASGSEVFTSHRPRPGGGELIELEVPGEAIDVSLHLHLNGYAPRQVLGIPVTPSGAEATPIDIPLERGIDCQLKLVEGESVLGERERGLLFLVHEDQAASLRGPFPSQGGPSNSRINGVNMWIADPGLLAQMPRFDNSGAAILMGLRPGTYALHAFPDDLAFEPATFALPAGATSPVTVELRCLAR